MEIAKPITMVACPTCRKPVPWTTDEKFKPFCGERCKMIDLGEWATEAYAIPIDTTEEPEDWDGGINNE